MSAGLEERLAEVRDRTLALVDGLADDDVHRPLDPIMSPLVWDLAHIAAYEDLWAVHRLGGEPLLHEDLAATYDAFETPRAVRGEIELLDRPRALRYLADVRERTVDVLRRTGASELHDLVALHELQHTETMRQALFLGGLPGGAADAMPRFSGATEFIAVPAGPARIGAPEDDGFAYDNERPRHELSLGAFEIARAPVTNASWLRFSEGGGYERREWWSDEGWSWKQCYDITHPLGWDAGTHPDEPVQHVSWFEADAFARSQGCRLPTEAEWERAATSDQERPAGVGLVWEWTASEFAGYPGFRAHPYREYSEVFFGRGYRVLRGGCWATAPGVASPTFRNWDLPKRRQIFSGLRLARGS
ncbi:MAG: egtB [Solirubrobacteraceae bacterium]|nr:egtB [Solirubrobacteraceae bacterium]